MELAINVAKRGWGNVAPNPLVGCVILDRDNRFLAKGAHLKYGEAHAEVNAINKVQDKEKLRGATVFVTLEPCSHEGKTPSCAKMLVKFPLQKVYYGSLDPNPLVSGKGIEILKGAAIEVEHFEEFEKPSQLVTEMFFHQMHSDLPFVAMKAAVTSNGYLELPKDMGRWVTGEKSRNYVHYLRAGYDAILVGSGTVKKDNPKLNIRHNKFGERENSVIVLDTHGDLINSDIDLELKKVRDPKKIFWVVSEETKLERTLGFQIIRIPKKDNFLDLKALLKNLTEKGIRSIFIEGGAKIYESFLAEGLVQRAYVFRSPVAIMDKSLHYLDLKFMGQLKNIEERTFEEDKFTTGTFYT